MKNRSVILITTLFSLMLVGIIIIQAWWINHVIDLNRKSFDEAVYKSLASTVKKVEEKENFVFIQRQVETDTLLKKTKNLLKKRSAFRLPKQAQVAAFSNSDVQVSVTSDNGKQTKTIIRIEKDKNGKKYVHNSVYVSSLSDSLDVPIPPEPALVIDPPLPPDIENISIVDDKKENVEIIMEKMMSLRDPDSVSIPSKEIEKILAEQLKQNDLPKEFQIYILNQRPKKSYIGNLDTMAKIGWAPYRVNLYPNDLFGREATLAVRFPIDQLKMKGNMWGAIALSVFFTVSLLLLFMYSIRMLMRHKKMLEMKNDFINHMSHEFKTPLAGITLGADILMTEAAQKDPEQINKVAGTIKKQSLRLSKEINDVLQDALLEQNISKPFVLFDLAKVIQNQIEMFQPLAEQAGAKINVTLSSEKILINGDENQWHKVFSNLIDNALKFSKEAPVIKIDARTEGKKVQITVQDNGIGISVKDLPHIFDKFFRSDYYKRSNIQGFGLGLSLVRSVVQAHGGTVKAVSELNKGTTIVIEVNADQ